ncbi:hypothetical protein WA577_000348, partial [Blastocystis sp. JDR]
MSLFKSQEWMEEHSHLICSKRELFEALFPKPAFVVEWEKEKQIKKVVASYVPSFIFLLCFSVFFYTWSATSVPITHRRAYIPMSYETDLSFRDRVVKEEYKDGKYRVTVFDIPVITNTNNAACRMVSRVADDMKRAGQYFDPSAREYLNHMEVFVVDTPMVNAFYSIGGVIIVFSGVIDYYKQLEASGKITSAENSVAGVIAHEMAHSIARHSVERYFDWRSILTNYAIDQIKDYFFLPLIAKVVDMKIQQNQEAEADFIALYLLKRAGYDTSEFGRSMKLLGDEPDDPIDYFRALFIDHPRFMDRENSMNRSVPKVDEDFEELYCVEEKSWYQRLKRRIDRRMDA